MSQHQRSQEPPKAPRKISAEYELQPGSRAKWLFFENLCDLVPRVRETLRAGPVVLYETLYRVDVERGQFVYDDERRAKVDACESGVNRWAEALNLGKEQWASKADWD